MLATNLRLTSLANVTLFAGAWQEDRPFEQLVDDDNQCASKKIAAALQTLHDLLKPQRRVVHAGDLIYRAGERFNNLFVLNSGLAKTVNFSVDGREQVVGLKFRGDWLGLDGIASARYCCDAVAMDTGDVWLVPYQELLVACSSRLELLSILLQAISRDIAQDGDSLMSVCTLPAEARVADFLRYWAESLAKRGMRTDQITIRMTRAEMGNCLGLTMESVSRALSRLARRELICFSERSRREIRIPDVHALSGFVQATLVRGPALIH